MRNAVSRPPFRRRRAAAIGDGWRLAKAGPRPRLILPRHAPGLRIGLLGGSFNPAHAGHRLASLVALRRLGLDRVWWLVTPGNPLKDNAALAPLQARLAAARKIAAHPRIDVTGIEAALGTSFTHDTITRLLRRCHGVRFVWLMGADALADFHRWRQWRALADLVPIAVIDRPGTGLAGSRSRAASALSVSRLDEADAALLPWAEPPAWLILHGPRSDLSSTRLRTAPA